MKRVYVGDFHLGADEKRAVMDVLDQGRISEGRKTREFERLWAEYIGTKYAVALSSGTAAAIVGFSALAHLKKLSTKQRKVITSPITYISTANALVVADYEPVFVDINPKTFGITAENVERHMSSVQDPENYVAVKPVHLMGYPVDIDGLRKVCDKYKLVLVEDSAQAHGSIYKGRKTGSFGLFSIFSFYIAHNIQAGEMGALNTDDIELYKLVKKLKANGRMCSCVVCTRHEGKCPHRSLDDQDHDPRFTHDMIGYNFKTMEFQTALGISQLKKADDIFQKRQHNVQYLNEKLKKYESLLQLPVFDKNVSYLAYPVLIKNNKGWTRKKLRHLLEQNGVENRPLFGCIPTQQPAYGYLKEQYTGKLPNAEYVGNNGFYIGCHQYLTTEDLDYVVSVFNKVMGDTNH